MKQRVLLIHSSSTKLRNGSAPSLVKLLLPPTSGGSVTGAGTYEMGDIVSLTATPDTGYKFTNWSINDVIVSTEVTYQYSVKADEVLKANFLSLMPLTTSTSLTKGFH